MLNIQIYHSLQEGVGVGVGESRNSMITRAELGCSIGWRQVLGDELLGEPERKDDSKTRVVRNRASKASCVKKRESQHSFLSSGVGVCKKKLTRRLVSIALLSVFSW